MHQKGQPVSQATVFFQLFLMRKRIRQGWITLIASHNVKWAPLI